MFAEYQEEVLRAYHRKMAANQLRTTLVHPTPANLRDECLSLVEKRFEKNDLYALSSFFGERADQTAYAEAIRKCDIDLFRPLIKLLKGTIKTTDRKNVELLAWMIDYQRRPYQAGKTATFAGPDQQAIAVESLNVVSLLRNPENKRNRRLIAMFLAVLVLLAVGSFRTWGTRPDEGCMVWMADHYQPVSCSQRQGEGMVLALDTAKLTHFRKITRTDTLTARSVGKVWYSKISNQVEFFTANGFHPEHVERHLKPATAYMIHKYAGHP